METVGIIRKGSTGEMVEWLQMALNELGFNCGPADGMYGNKTVSAVAAFQDAYGLEPDGIAGSLTQTALMRAVAKKEASQEEEEEEMPAEEEIISIWKLLDERVTALEERLKRAGL